MEIIQVKDYYEIFDEHGKFICSADSYREAEEEVHEYLSKRNKKRGYTVSYSAAKSRWITRNGERLQIPIEESHHHSTIIEATSPQAAINSIQLPGYIITNIQVA